MKKSAGILAYYQEDCLRVFLVHPGGPFYLKKDSGVWSIPKGEYEDEDPLQCAKKEFFEETGNIIDIESSVCLGDVFLKSRKKISIWAVSLPSRITFIKSNTFQLEWPPKSGRIQTFTEVDRAEWFEIEEAREKIHPGQMAFLDRLVNLVCPSKL